MSVKKPLSNSAHDSKSRFPTRHPAVLNVPEYSNRWRTLSHSSSWYHWSWNKKQHHINNNTPRLFKPLKITFVTSMKNDLAFHNLSVKDSMELALDKPLRKLLAESRAKYWNGANRTAECLFYCTIMLERNCKISKKSLDKSKLGLVKIALLEPTFQELTILLIVQLLLNYIQIIN